LLLASLPPLLVVATLSSLASAAPVVLQVAATLASSLLVVMSAAAASSEVLCGTLVTGPGQAAADGLREQLQSELPCCMAAALWQHACRCVECPMGARCRIKAPDMVACIRTRSCWTGAGCHSVSRRVHRELDHKHRISPSMISNDHRGLGTWWPQQAARPGHWIIVCVSNS
jgi:hypothetical protein